MTNRLSLYIIDKLRNEVSFSSVAREVNLSVSSVIRVFDLVSYAPKKLPSAISIDEFKGNTTVKSINVFSPILSTRLFGTFFQKDMRIS